MHRIQIQEGALLGSSKEIPKYQPLFFSEALFLQAVKHTVAALRQDFLDLMSGKTELDEASLIDY